MNRGAYTEGNIGRGGFKYRKWLPQFAVSSVVVINISGQRNSFTLSMWLHLSRRRFRSPKVEEIVSTKIINFCKIHSSPRRISFFYVLVQLRHEKRTGFHLGGMASWRKKTNRCFSSPFLHAEEIITTRGGTPIALLASLCSYTVKSTSSLRLEAEHSLEASAISRWRNHYHKRRNSYSAPCKSLFLHGKVNEFSKIRSRALTWGISVISRRRNHFPQEEEPSPPFKSLFVGGNNWCIISIRETFTMLKIERDIRGDEQMTTINSIWDRNW